MRRVRSLAVALGVFGWTGCNGCRSDSPGEDAAAPLDETLSVPKWRVEVAVPSAWRRLPARSEDVVEALRDTSGGAPLGIAPRLVLTFSPLEARVDTEILLRRAIDETKATLPPSDARPHRTSTSRWTVDGVDVSAFRLDYTVLNPTGGAGREIVHRTALAIREDPQGSPFLLDLTVTYLEDGDAAVDREVESMLRSLHFLAPESQ